MKFKIRPGKSFGLSLKAEMVVVPIYWDETAHAGFTKGQPWLPVNPESSTEHQAAQYHHPDSIWHWTRTLLKVRKGLPELATAPLIWHESHPNVLHFYRGRSKFECCTEHGSQSGANAHFGKCLLTGRELSHRDTLTRRRACCLI